MDTFLQRVYVGEIKTQCEFALSAASHLTHALQNLNTDSHPPERRQFFHREVFRQIHSFLTHTSNVSRLFWPPVPAQRRNETDAAYASRLSNFDRVQRAEKLRALYEIEDTSPLRNRALRDHLEHFDERLDEWRRTSTHRNIANDLIGPKNMIVGLADTDMMRWFDPSDRLFRFRGEEYDLQGLASQIDRLLPLSKHLEEHLWNAQTGRA